MIRWNHCELEKYPAIAPLCNSSYQKQNNTHRSQPNGAPRLLWHKVGYPIVISPFPYAQGWLPHIVTSPSQFAQGWLPHSDIPFPIRTRLVTLYWHPLPHLHKVGYPIVTLPSLLAQGWLPYSDIPNFAICTRLVTLYIPFPIWTNLVTL